MALSAGTKLGSYEITGAIGAGGMGEVYRARDAKLGRDVALKVLPEAFARDAERMARFQREAKVLASLNHPNIASIYGLEDSGSTHALVMELVGGPTLAERVKQGPIPVDEALRIAKQIAEAVEYAHERGIVHRDLKPANVKVTNEDAVKVLDFGLAKALEGDASGIDIANSPTVSRLATQAGVLLGTAAYMSPEQAKGRSVDRRADIWAFGCVLYEMLTGKMVFRGEAVTETLAAVLKSEPDWSQLPAATPIRVRVLLQRCLQKDSKQRLQAIGDARISLDEVLSGAPDPSLAEAAGMPAPLWRRTLPWALGFLAVAIAGVAGWILKPTPKSPPAEPVVFQIPVPEQLAGVGTGTFALSPDGRQLAFVASGADGVERIWVRPLGSLEARPLTGTESAAIGSLFWSPDSQFIAFESFQTPGTGGSGELKKIAGSGGPAETICHLIALSVGGSRNRDGAIIFASGRGLMSVSAAGGSAWPLTTAASGGFDLYPQFLPDGRHFIYLRIVPDPRENSGIYLGSLDVKPGQQDSKRLLPHSSGAIYVPSSDPSWGRLLFRREGTLFAQRFDVGRAELSGEAAVLAEGLRSNLDYSTNFSASANGVVAYVSGSGNISTNRLTWFDRQGKVQGTASAPNSDNSVVLSPDASRALIFDAISGIGGMWLVDFQRGTRTRFTFPSSPAGEDVGDAVWSSDGSRVIFVSNRDGPFVSLYEKPVSGATDEVLLLKSADVKHPHSWSPDGRFLLYDGFGPTTGKSGIWVLPLGGDKKPLPVLNGEFDEGDAQISPDGRWMAYGSDESGQPEVYVREFSPDSAGSSSAAGGKWQISTGGGVDALWREDGKELYYRAPDGKVMAVEVVTRPTLQAGAAKELFQGPPLLFALGASMPSQWGVTADGKRFLFEVPVAPTAQTSLTVVLNWQAGLKK